MSADDFTRARYREILGAGRGAGYRFAGFGEIAALKQAEDKVCLLRHDCDNDLVAAARMAEIEAETGIRSTYFVMLRSAMYNLLAPSNAALVRRILSLGHRLGLHFDESVVADRSDADAAVAVDREREVLRTEFGDEVDAVSFHQPGARVLEGRLRLGCVNTYDRRDMAGFHYTSDSNLVFRGGAPDELFRSGAHQRLHVLIHPEWWTDQAMSVAEKWDAMLLDNLELTQASLLAREDTFTERRTVRLTPGKPRS